MVTTRRSKYDAFAEEKKDDDDITARRATNMQHATKEEIHSISPPIRMNGTVTTQQDVERTQKKSPLLLLLCATGITSCYLWYGTVQETLNSSRGEESITLFLLATGTFSSFLLAWIWTNIGRKLLTGSQDEKTEGKLNHVLLVLTSMTYLSAMAASNESLHYVSYPTCVLAKSSKLIPTMVVGWLVDKIRGQSHGGNKAHSNMEWIGAALITTGIISFQYTQLQKQHSNHGGNAEKGDSPYGLFLLSVSLFMDGLLGACQSALKRKGSSKSMSVCRPPTAMETMLYINLYATAILLPASYYAGQFQNGVKVALDANGDVQKLLLQLNLSASLGQVFIFLTIHHFSPLICTTITTTRKFFTILLSVYKFGHVLDVWQWGSVGLVFSGLYLEIAAKMLVGQRPDVQKKKAE